MLTSLGVRGQREEARAAGLDGYLVKPIRQSQFFDCLATVMAGSGPSAPAPAKAATTAEGGPSPGGHGPRVLLAEDNPINQSLALRLLQKLGCRVDVAGNGREAVAAAARADYALIFMDCQMPEMDGFEATAAIRKAESASGRVPIIALTASAMQGDREACLGAGMDDYLSKPLRFGDLERALRHWLGGGTGAAEGSKACS
jgi:CheY-like chemotaxis protein